MINSKVKIMATHYYWLKCLLHPSKGITNNFISIRKWTAWTEVIV